MALQFNLPDTKSPIGLAAPAAYARITGMDFILPPPRSEQKDPTVKLTVAIYATKGARDNGLVPLSTRTFTAIVGKTLPSLDAPLPKGVRAALYAWLKTLPEFSGSQDV